MSPSSLPALASTFPGTVGQSITWSALPETFNHNEDNDASDDSSEYASTASEMTSDDTSSGICVNDEVVKDESCNPRSASIKDIDDEWDTADLGINDEWNTVENRLSIQANSGSIIAEHLSCQGILIKYNAPLVLAAIESTIQKRIILRRILFRRQWRHRRTILINTEGELQKLLDRLERLDHTRPQVVVDCEGLDYKKHGTIDIMELYVMAFDMLYLIDVVEFGEHVWSVTSTRSAFCLRAFLSSSSYKKIMWDLRMDAHILNALYGIRLSGIVDCSLWDVAWRRQLCSTMHSCRRSIESACNHFLGLRIGGSELQSLEDAKQKRGNLAPRPWALRPLSTVLIDYTADVKYMGILYRIFAGTLLKYPQIVEETEFYTEQELEIACDPFYDTEIDKGADSPWCYRYLERARESLASAKKYAALELESGADVGEDCCQTHDDA